MRRRKSNIAHPFGASFYSLHHIRTHCAVSTTLLERNKQHVTRFKRAGSVGQGSLERSKEARRRAAKAEIKAAKRAYKALKKQLKKEAKKTSVNKPTVASRAEVKKSSKKRAREDAQVSDCKGKRAHKMSARVPSHPLWNLIHSIRRRFLEMCSPLLSARDLRSQAPFRPNRGLSRYLGKI